VPSSVTSWKQLDKLIQLWKPVRPAFSAPGATSVASGPANKLQQLPCCLQDSSAGSVNLFSSSSSRSWTQIIQLSHPLEPAWPASAALSALETSLASSAPQSRSVTSGTDSSSVRPSHASSTSSCIHHFHIINSINSTFAYIKLILEFL
jgi:hypothetical protein